MAKRKRDEEERKRYKEERRKAKLAEIAAKAGPAAGAGTAAAPARPAVPATPIAFLFPGQGSQAVGMLKVGGDGSVCESGQAGLVERVSWMGLDWWRVRTQGEGWKNSEPGWCVRDFFPLGYGRSPPPPYTHAHARTRAHTHHPEKQLLDWCVTGSTRIWQCTEYYA